jgi:rSAM/selenodomain-associated transferase 1
MARAADVLVVMAKYPRPGQVKTRLAQRFGAEAACRLYEAFLVDIARRFAGKPFALLWAVDPPRANLGKIVGAPAECVDQIGADLGQRMRHCFEQILAEGAQRVVMIGADVPHIPESTIDGAFTALTDHDVALAPSPDGGYCLVALRRPIDLFTPIEMSTPRVFSDTGALIERRGLRLQLLPECFDVDEPEDIDALACLIETGGANLPRTRSVLAQLRTGHRSPVTGHR